MSTQPLPKSLRKLRPESLLTFSRKRRLPLILQTEITECGLACLAMISGYHGYDTDIINLRKYHSISSQGARLNTIIDIAAKLHFSARALRCEPDDLRKIKIPCILHWGMNHFVVLKSIKKDRILIHDPAVGEKCLTQKEFSQQFTGIALELLPTPSFKKKNDSLKLKLSDFWTKAIGLKRSLIQLVFLSFLLQLFVLISPFYLQTVVDDVLLSKDEELLFILAVGFGLLLVIEIITHALREFVILYLSNRMSIQMSANLFRHFIRLPISYFTKRRVGDVISRFSSLDVIRKALTSTLVIALVDGVMAILTLIIMFIYDTKLTFILLGITAVYALIRFMTYSSFKSANTEHIQAAAKENSHFIESVKAIQTIKIFGMENDRQYQWLNRLAYALNKGIRISQWNINFSLSNKFLFGLENILIIYFAALAVINESMSLGMLYAFIAYKLRFTTSIDSFITQWMEFKILDLHMDRLADIAFFQPEGTNSERELDDEIIAPDDKGISGKIEAKNLGYRYSEYEPWTFRHMNFTILPGESVALTGPSGCGKTTLIKCLMGLLHPTEGEILIDGTPIHKLPCYRSQLAGVMQDDQLLAGDIANNISCFQPIIDMEKVRNCARMACIDDDIQSLPMRYNTLVGDMGSSLSGGQKQRVILARALYRSPKLLFMDEATSNLDSLAESIVNDNIKKLRITRIFAAHREGTVASADWELNLNTSQEIL